MAAQRTLTREEGRAALAAPKRHKYGAKRTIIDGQSFASKAEAAHFCTLRLLERAGHIHSLQLQTRFYLKVNGLLICKYVADFVYYDTRDGKRHIIDVKGYSTALYVIKKKLMLACHGIEIEEVKA